MVVRRFISSFLVHDKHMRLLIIVSKHICLFKANESYAINIKMPGNFFYLAFYIIIQKVTLEGIF